MAELDQLHGIGLGVGLIWETSAERMASGYAGGVADAQEALQEASAINWPAALPIYFADDEKNDIPLGVVNNYTAGVKSVFGLKPRGYYGGKIADAEYRWLVGSWIGDPTVSMANLVQHGQVFNGTADENVAVKTDIGCYFSPQLKEA